MPIYEYACTKCRKRFRKLMGMTAVSAALVCPHCGAEEPQRLLSRFARIRGDEEALDALADEMEGLDESSPAAMRRMMKTLSGELGEDLDEGDLEQMMEGEENSEDTLE